MKRKKITYKSAGVDIEAGYRSVAKIKGIVKKTFTKGVMSNIGLFGGGFALDTAKYKNPILVSGADGVGSKVSVAFKMDKHDTVGMDMVAMNVDDIVAMGAKPLFLLDYIGCNKLDPDNIAAIVSGIAKGCKQAGCALIGGETAEMPDLYKKGEYDIAGFAVGVVDKDKIIDGSKVKVGDVLIGLRSSGLHSNGYALARKVVFEIAGMNVNSRVEGLNGTVGEELLTPTRIYASSILSVINKFKVKGIAHITGGGLLENVERILPKGTKALIYRARWEPQLIFKIIKGYGSINDDEMFKVFNMGIGMVLAVSKKDSVKIIKKFISLGEEPIQIGEIVKGKKEVEIL